MAEDKKKKVVPEQKPFVHLHLHSEYSLLDGAARISGDHCNPLLQACVAKGMPACALTDHGNMFGAYTFYKAAKEAGIKPIVGCEFYTCPDLTKNDTKERCHLVLLAKTTEGYRNIVKMDSIAYVDGYYYKPRIDIELLKKHTKGVICLSACLSGKIPSLLLQNDYNGAKEYALMLRDMFEEGDFYIEIQDHGIPEQKQINPLLVKLAKEIGVKVVATNDVHYIEKSDAEMHDVLLCIQTASTIDDPTRMKFDSDNFYLKDYDEMSQLFAWCPEAIANTNEVMEKCNIEIKKEELMPPYHPEDGSTPPEYLRKLAYDGLVERYGELTDEIKQRAEYELDIIIRMGFAEYYLIVWDFIHYARQQGIPVGAGRGSGVSSIIAYAIHITNVDPLKYNLLFERFLNPERISAPDFDIDFCMDRRGEVIEYVTQKYGKDKVCQILALGTMKAKGAIKDVARVYKVPLDIVNKTTKCIPNTPGLTLQQVLGWATVPSKITDPEERAEKENELKKNFCPEVLDIYKTNDEMHRVIDMALKIEGMPRNCSKHAAGVVICREVISDFVPLQRNGNDITTQFQKEEVEQLGMLKMDFLGLTTLTDISKAKQYIMENHGVDVDFEKLGYEDPEVYKLISSGETDAVFQLEGSGMKKFMRELQPTNLEDIIAGISLYRPGPIKSIPDYVIAKHNPEKITYETPLLIPLLHMTYGFLVYQEQVMQCVQTLAGYSLGRADILRRAMGKKKSDVMAAEKTIFINGCPAKPVEYYADGTVKESATPAVDGAVKRGVPADAASRIFDNMQDFAKYAFNKSHAAAYSVLAYETAYLKRYYMPEFVSAVVNDRLTKADEIAKYWLFLKEKGVPQLPPDVNKSDTIFRVQNGAVRFGLCGIKNVSENAMKLLVEERKQNGEYSSISDMLLRLPASTITKKSMESLIKAGALDCFGHTRASLMACYERLLATSNVDKRKQASGQMSLFGMFGAEETNVDDIPYLQEFGRMQYYAQEKEVLSVYMSGHPLEAYEEAIKNMPFNFSMIADLLFRNETEDDDATDDANNEVDKLAREYNDREIVVGGMISNFRKSVTKSGKLMAYGMIEDTYGAIEVIFFPATLGKYKDLLFDDAIVTVKGRLDTLTDPKVKLFAKEVAVWKQNDDVSAGGDRKLIVSDDENYSSDEQFAEVKKKSEKTLYLKVRDLEQYRQLTMVLEKFAGEIDCKIQYDRKLFQFPTNVDVCENLMMQIASLIGKENIVVK
ncbi:MAG: DNA polymerase III subunit alpha [Clostridia bacterium]